MAAAPPSFILLLILLIFAVAVDSRPSSQRGDKQVLHALFGSHLPTLILASSTSDDITEGSTGHPAQATSPSSGVLPLSHVKQPVDRKEAVPRFFLDFLRRQAKTRRRSRKSMVGGRGCFGMKMDRIGSVSGLGC